MRRAQFLVFTSLVIAPLVLGGCFNGQGATTTMQAGQATGNGVQAQVGLLRVENATMVTGPEGSNSATLLMRVVNQGSDADRLLSATIDGVRATITGDSVELPPGSSISFAYDSDVWVNSYDFDAEPSAFVDVTLVFEKSGDAKLQVLTVPPLSFYAGIAPNPPAT